MKEHTTLSEKHMTIIKHMRRQERLFFLIIFNHFIQIFTLNLRINKEGFHHRNNRVNLRRRSADAVMDLRHTRTVTR